jgi:hypothetical protein
MKRLLLCITMLLALALMGCNPPEYVKAEVVEIGVTVSAYSGSDRTFHYIIVEYELDGELYQETLYPDWWVNIELGDTINYTPTHDREIVTEVQP